ncbi:putative Phytocyanin domain, cupredoxin [Helianthus annuus]|nr:putative Phytocyanin domain, cupredoxin [Helianthus annuus]
MPSIAASNVCQDQSVVFYVKQYTINTDLRPPSFARTKKIPRTSTMVTNKLAIVIFIGLIATLATSVSATDFIVGDEYGWTLNFDYQAWAQGKKFIVGDKLVFKYPVGKHNVFKVDGNGFKGCVVPAANESLASGYDVVTLTTPGKKWYICGVGKHCETGGMKLVIDVLAWSPVLPLPVPAPAPGPVPSGKVFVVGDDYGWTLNFDYQAWAKGKEFVVGDKLVFKYPVGKHNVFKVDGNGFKGCVVPASNESLTSGYDVITLTTPGKKWYICGVGTHCETGGMKLVIDVLSWSPVQSVSNPVLVPVPAPAPSPVPLGNMFIVGDDYGWTLDFDYQAWAKGKEFVVGDKLVFIYPKGAHNVYKVNGTDFQQCTIPVSGEPLSSGYDWVTLTTPGRKWYICGVGKHCQNGGMKLVIDVLPRSTYPPSPSPWGSYKARRLGNTRVLGRVA